MARTKKFFKNLDEAEQEFQNAIQDRDHWMAQANSMIDPKDFREVVAERDFLRKECDIKDRIVSERGEFLRDIEHKLKASEELRGWLMGVINRLLGDR